MLNVISPPVLSDDERVAAVQTRLYQAIMAKEEEFRSMNELQRRSGIIDMHVIRRMLDGSYARKNMQDPRIIKHMRALSRALGQDQYYLEGGLRPTGKDLPRGTRVRNARLNIGISIFELSRRSGLNHSPIHNVENLTIVPPFQTTERTLRLLGKALQLEDL